MYDTFVSLCFIVLPGEMLAKLASDALLVCLHFSSYFRCEQMDWALLFGFPLWPDIHPVLMAFQKTRLNTQQYTLI